MEDYNTRISIKIKDSYNDSINLDLGVSTDSPTIWEFADCCRRAALAYGYSEVLVNKVFPTDFEEV